MLHTTLQNTLHRLFFALRPDVAAARRIAVLRERLRIGGTPVALERLHLTLAILADREAPDAGLREVLARIGAQVAALVMAFPCTLDHASGGAATMALRPRRRIAGLTDLHEALARGLRGAGLAMRPGWSFTPHVTLAYRDGHPAAHPVKPIAWEADELLLIDSHLGRTHHDVIGRWPLVRQLALL